MTQVIDYRYEEDKAIENAQRECKIWWETIEALEELRNDPTVDKNELDEAIEEANRKYNEAEELVINLTWSK